MVRFNFSAILVLAGALALAGCQQPGTGGGENIFVQPVRAGVFEMNQRLEGEHKTACFITSIIVSDLIKENPDFREADDYSCDAVVNVGGDEWRVHGFLGLAGEDLPFVADARTFVEKRSTSIKGGSAKSWTIDELRIDDVVAYKAGKKRHTVRSF